MMLNMRHRKLICTNMKPKKELKRNKRQRFLNWINLKYITVIMLTIILTTLARDFNEKYILQVPIEWKGFTRERFVSPIPKEFDSKHVIDPKNPEPGIKNISPTMTPTPTPKKKAHVVDLVRDVEASEVSYPYESLRLDSEQKRVASIVEARLGKAGAQLVFKESGFHNTSVNSSSGACGLFQAYPCEKMACSLDDIDCQLNWGESYILRRYGSPEKALSFHLENGWY